MNKYDVKALNIRSHLTDNPNDYKSVVSLYKAESDSIVYERNKRFNEQKKLVAEIRRMLNEESE